MDGYEDTYDNDSYVGNEKDNYLLIRESDHIYEETEYEVFNLTPQESFSQSKSSSTPLTH